MTNLGSVESDLERVLSWLDDTEQYHLDRAKHARESKAAARHTAQLLRQWQLESAPTGGGGTASHFGVSPSDIVRCPSIREALAVIACGSNGYLHYRSAARIIMAAELSSSKSLDNLSRDLFERLKQDKEHWTHDSPGVYRYLPYVRKDPVGTAPISTALARPSPHLQSPGGRRNEDDPS